MKPKQGTTCAKKNGIMQLSSSGLKIKKRTNKSKFIREILNNESLKKKEQKQMMEYSPESAGKNENDKIASSSSEEKEKGKIEYNQSNEEFVKALEDELENELLNTRMKIKYLNL